MSAEDYVSPSLRAAPGLIKKALELVLADWKIQFTSYFPHYTVLIWVTAPLIQSDFQRLSPIRSPTFDMSLHSFYPSGTRPL